MLLNNGCHLTYCTNIHSGESWEEHFNQLKQYVPAIRRQVAPEERFGIGLRLAALAGETLSNPAELDVFKAFLDENNLYVFTMNGFPYGNFHQSRVKEQVHQPDWQTNERLTYTKNLFGLLEKLVPQGLDGGISTSPLSYMPWFSTEEKLNTALEASLVNLVDIVVFLYKIKESKGIFLHMDIEPEPDGVLENSNDVVLFYNELLLKKGTSMVAKHLGIDNLKAEEAIRDHIQICYDVCHFALVYESPAEAFDKFKKEGIGIGKVQLSAALSTAVGKGKQGKEELKQFEEGVYLHQVITRDEEGDIKSYGDLPQTFEECPADFEGEWRVHFHVPLFMEQYGHLSSTQQDVVKTLELIQQEKRKVHLEVETYTWDVLPASLKLDIDSSISRELEWVKKLVRA